MSTCGIGTCAVACAQWRWVIVMLVVSLALVACGPMTPEEATAPTQPPATSPSAMPEPPTATPPEPTEGPTATPQPSPTPRVVPPVEMSSLETYQHTRRIFAVDVPPSWEVVEQGSDDAPLVSFTAPFESAQMHINVRTDEPDASDAPELDLLLRRFIEEQWADTANLEIGETEPQPDGSIRIAFTCATTVNEVPTTLLGNSFVQRDEDMLSMLSIAVPQEQFAALQPALDIIVNSFEIDERVATANQPAVVRLEPLQPYSHPASLFALDVPATWEVTDQSTYIVTEIAFRDRYETGTIIVTLSDAQGEMSSAELGEVLQQRIERDYSETIYRFNAVVNSPVLQDDGSMRVTFTYDTMIRGVQTTMLGSSFIQRQGVVDTILIVIVPQRQFSLLNETLNTIINSFQPGPSLLGQ